MTIEKYAVAVSNSSTYDNDDEDYSDDVFEDDEYTEDIDEWGIYLEKFNSMLQPEMIIEISNNVEDYEYVEKIVEYFDLSEYRCWVNFLIHVPKNIATRFVETLIDASGSNSAVTMALSNKKLRIDGLVLLLDYYNANSKLPTLFRELPDSLNDEQLNKIAKFIIDSKYNGSIKFYSAIWYKLKFKIMLLDLVTFSYFDAKSAENYSMDLLANVQYGTFFEKMYTAVVVSCYQKFFGFDIDRELDSVFSDTFIK